MPEMTPVGNTNYVPPPGSGVDTFSSILGLKRRQANIQSAQAQAILDQRKAKETQALAGIDWRQFENDDGSYDIDAVNKAATTVAPTIGPEFAQHWATMAQGSAETKAAFLALNKEQQSQVGSTFGAWAADKDATTTDLAKRLDALYDTVPRGSSADMHTIGEHAMRILSNSPEGQRKQVAASLSRAWTPNESLTGPGGVIAPNRVMMQGKDGLQAVEANPNAIGGAGPTGPQMPQGVPPGFVETHDANGRSYYVNPQTNTMLVPGAGRGPQAQAGQGGGPRFVQPIAGQEQAQGEVNAARTADADYGQNRFVNDQILRLSKNVATGPGTDIWHHALGAIAGPAGGNNVADYQTISAYLDRQAALLSHQMGVPNTNAGLQAAAGAAGTTGYQPEALQAKVRLTDAMIEGAHRYRQGLDKVVGTGPNQDLAKYQTFRNAWTSNFDPTAMMLVNAKKRGDNDEYKSILNGLSADQRKELAAKARALDSLSRGEIPGG